MKFQPKKIFGIVILACMMLPLSAAASDAGVLLDKAEASFREGNELLKTDPEAAKDAYRLSIQYYNSIIESGINNAGLYYNIANAYIRLEQPGAAILNYRRALLFSPNDKQIRSNLEYARSLQKNGFEAEAENEILHILFFWHYLLPTGIKTAALIIFNLLFWGALILARLGRPVRGLAVAAVILLVITAASVFIDVRNADVQHGVVTAESTIGRLGDSRSYESAFDAPLFQGVEFTIKQKRVGWLLAELPTGGLVWLEESACEIIEDLN